MPEPDATPPIACDHDAPCPVCFACTECYPHEPGTWPPGGSLTDPCRGAAQLKHLNDLEQMERIAADIAERSNRPRDQRHAGRLLDDIQSSRSRLLGTGEL